MVREGACMTPGVHSVTQKQVSMANMGLVTVHNENTCMAHSYTQQHVCIDSSTCLAACAYKHVIRILGVVWSVNQPTLGSKSGQPKKCEYSNGTRNSDYSSRVAQGFTPASENPCLHQGVSQSAPTSTCERVCTRHHNMQRGSASLTLSVEAVDIADSTACGAH